MGYIIQIKLKTADALLDILPVWQSRKNIFLVWNPTSEYFIFTFTPVSSIQYLNNL